MPKATHFHTTHDALGTDKKLKTEDEALYAKDKREFQESEQDKKAEPVSEEEFVREQDKKSED